MRAKTFVKSVLRKMLVGTCLTIVAGCAQQTAYTVPEAGEPQATITFVGPTGPAGPTELLIFFPDGEHCTGHGLLPQRYNPFVADAEPLPIPADQVVAVLRGYQAISFPKIEECHAMLSFQSNHGNKYRSLYSPTDEGCSALIEYYDAASDLWLPEPTSRQRQYKVPWANAGPWCE